MSLPPFKKICRVLLIAVYAWLAAGLFWLLLTTFIPLVTGTLSVEQLFSMDSLKDTFYGFVLLLLFTFRGVIMLFEGQFDAVLFLQIFALIPFFLGAWKYPERYSRALMVVGIWINCLVGGIAFTRIALSY